MLHFIASIKLDRCLVDPRINPYHAFWTGDSSQVSKYFYCPLHITPISQISNKHLELIRGEFCDVLDRFYLIGFPSWLVIKDLFRISLRVAVKSVLFRKGSKILHDIVTFKKIYSSVFCLFFIDELEEEFKFFIGHKGVYLRNRQSAHHDIKPAYAKNS